MYPTLSAVMGQGSFCSSGRLKKSWPTENNSLISEGGMGWFFMRRKPHCLQASVTSFAMWSWESGSSICETSIMGKDILFG